MRIKKPLPTANLKQLRTKDLHLTAFLTARGSRLMAVDRIGGVVFFTLAAEDLSELVQDFHGNGQVRILDFCGRLRDLKTLIFEDAGSLSSGHQARI